MILSQADDVKIGNDAFPRAQAIFSGEYLTWERVAETSILAYQINDSNDAYSVTGVNNTFESNDTIALQGYLTIPSTHQSLPVTAIAGSTSLSSMPFYNEDRLRGVTIPTSITSIGDYAFRSSDNITRMVLHNGITSIGSGAFQGLAKLKSIDLPSGLTQLDDFLINGCSSLTSVTIPSGVTIIGASVFGNCSGLTSITIPTGVTSIGVSAFQNCTGLTSITIPTGNRIISASLFNGCTSLTSVTFGFDSPPGQVKSIGERAFRGCTSLTGFTIPDGVNKIYSLAFSNCTSLTSITIPDSVTSIAQNAFDNTGLTFDVDNSIEYLISALGDVAVLIEDNTASGAVTIPNTVNGTSVTMIAAKAFRGNNNLSSVTIPNTVTSIGDEAFEDASCTSVTIGNSVTYIGDEAFNRCTSLSSITIPDSVTRIGRDAFNLTGVTLDEDNSIDYLISTTGNTAYLINGMGASGIVTIPNTVNGASVKAIGGDAFRFDSNLTRITIPDSVITIGSRAFNSISNLTNVTIGSGVTAIEYAAFQNCTSLSSISCYATSAPVIEDLVFNNIATTAINVPVGATGYGTVFGGLNVAYTL